MAAEPQVPPSTGPACERSPLPWWLRLAITFGVLFAMKWAMPLVGVAPALQVILLLVTATVCIWRFWWGCSPDRRGPLVMGAALWVAGLLKIALHW